MLQSFCSLPAPVTTSAALTNLTTEQPEPYSQSIDLMSHPDELPLAKVTGETLSDGYQTNCIV